MNRELTKREKVMIILLALILIGLCYFRFVLTPINDRIDEYRSMIDVEMDEQNTFLMPEVTKIRKMEREIREAKESETVKPIPHYNSSVSLVNELDALLANTIEKEITFPEELEMGEIVRRHVTISFATNNYAEAAVIIRKLHNSDHVNQISNVTMTRAGMIRQLFGDDDIFNTTLDVVFFEIMPNE